MANETLTMSPQGFQQLKSDEGAIDGLYDDPSHFCTSGVGHLVHRVDKWPSFLIAAARDSAKWRKLVLQSAATKYLPRATAFDSQFADLKAAAVVVAQRAIAKKNHKTDYENLAPADATSVTARAAAAVETEATALTTPTDVLLRNDIAPFEAAVRTKVTVQLDQAEFDALVSFTFNVGVGNFSSSTLLKKINLNEHMGGSATDRKGAADAIQAEFAKWNKSSGRILPGLTARRTSEAERFLARARQQTAATTTSFR